MNTPQKELKVWKPEGTQVKSLIMQSRDNLIKVVVIQAFIH